MYTKISEALLRERLREIDRNAHKGSNGTLNVVAGCERYRGAADLSVGAALRTGCGIVRLISEEAVIRTVSERHPSCTFLPVIGISAVTGAIISHKNEAFLVGNGLGVSPYSAAAVNYVLSTAKRAVLDADALNCLSACPEYYPLLKDKIITPHVGEFSRLTGMDISAIKADLAVCAAAFTEKYGCVTVLKDSVTAIACPSGSVYICDLASRGLSKGGSGDTLAGLIAGFLAQGYSSEDAAVIGASVLALSSADAAERLGVHSMLPPDLEDSICSLFSRLRN